MAYEINRDQMVARIMQAAGCRTATELADKLGMNRGVVHDWKRGRSINFEQLLETFGEEVDWNYIMVGRVGGVMLTQVRKLQADVENLAKTLQELENK